MTSRQNAPLLIWFVLYVVVVGTMYLSFPRIFGLRYAMPWDYWWVFLIVTPAVAAGVLSIGVRTGRYSGSAVAVFYLAAVAIGLSLGWLSYQLAGAV